ncbi:MAG: hypothetical protein HYT94_01025 [Parcubacteria group bacterium]|nr:hypothetical protein [Parcubacteria group bacterium]
MSETETLTRRFFQTLNQAQGRINAILADKHCKYCDEAVQIAITAIREALKLFPDIKVEYREKAAMALLGLVSWQGREIVPEVVKDMIVVFGDAMPGAVVAKLSALTAARTEYIRRHPSSVKIDFSKLSGPAAAGQKGGGGQAPYLGYTEGKKTNIGNAGNRVAPRVSKVK